MKELKKTEWLPDFENLMRNRLIVGAIRYKTFEEKRELAKKGIFYNCLEYMRQKLDLYERTGNMEALVDVANFCMIEFNSPSHPNAHFEAIDDGLHATVQ